MAEPLPKVPAFEAPALAGSATEPEYDVAAILDSRRWSLRHSWIFLICGLALLFDGLDSQLLGLALPAISQEFGVTPAAFAPVFASGIVGMAIGTVAAGWLGDRIGARRPLLACVLIFSVASAAIGLCNSLAAIAAARFVAGLGLGGLSPAVLALVAEFAPGRWRSTAIMLALMWLAAGTVVAAALSGVLLDALGWRDLFLIVAGAMPLVFLLVLIFGLPESPRALARSPNPRRQDRLARLLRQLGAEVAEGARPAVREEIRSKSSIATLFRQPYRHDTLSLIGAGFFSSLMSYSFGSWLPTALASIGLDAAARGLFLTIFTGSAFIGIPLGPVLVVRFGSRRTMVLIGAIAASAMALLASEQALFISMPWVICILFAVMGAAFTLNAAILSALVGNVYPGEIRGTGFGVSGGVKMLGALTSSFVGAAALALAGVAGFSALIGVAIVLMVLCGTLVGRQITAGRARVAGQADA